MIRLDKLEIVTESPLTTLMSSYITTGGQRLDCLGVWPLHVSMILTAHCYKTDHIPRGAKLFKTNKLMEINQLCYVYPAVKTTSLNLSSQICQLKISPVCAWTSTKESG